jgi:hypothetical protein
MDIQKLVNSDQLIQVLFTQKKDWLQSEIRKDKLFLNDSELNSLPDYDKPRLIAYYLFIHQKNKTLETYLNSEFPAENKKWTQALDIDTRHSLLSDLKSRVPDSRQSSFPRTKASEKQLADEEEEEAIDDSTSTSTQNKEDEMDDQEDINRQIVDEITQTAIQNKGDEMDNQGDITRQIAGEITQTPTRTFSLWDPSEINFEFQKEIPPSKWKKSKRPREDDKKNNRESYVYKRPKGLPELSMKYF